MADRDSLQKQIRRAKIILARAQRLGANAISWRTDVAQPPVRRWPKRFAGEGGDGVRLHNTRPLGTPPLPAATVERVVEPSLGEPPGGSTHWQGRAMGAAAGIGLGLVQAIRKSHGHAPHWSETFPKQLWT